MIFNGIKRRWMRKELRNNPAPVVTNLQLPESLLVISNEPIEKDVNNYYEWARRLGISAQNVTILGKVKDDKKQSIEKVITFDDKLIGWNGGYRKTEVEDVLNENYGVLISTYQQNDELLHFLGQRCQAQLKIGVGMQIIDHHDLTIQVDDYRKDNIIIELENYLKVLCKN